VGIKAVFIKVEICLSKSSFFLSQRNFFRLFLFN